MDSAYSPPKEEDTLSEDREGGREEPEVSSTVSCAYLTALIISGVCSGALFGIISTVFLAERLAVGGRGTCVRLPSSLCGSDEGDPECGAASGRGGSVIAPDYERVVELALRACVSIESPDLDFLLEGSAGMSAAGLVSRFNSADARIDKRRCYGLTCERVFQQFDHCVSERARMEGGWTGSYSSPECSFLPVGYNLSELAPWSRLYGACVRRFEYLPPFSPRGALGGSGSVDRFASEFPQNRVIGPWPPRSGLLAGGPSAEDLVQRGAGAYGSNSAFGLQRQASGVLESMRWERNKEKPEPASAILHDAFASWLIYRYLAGVAFFALCCVCAGAGVRGALSGWRAADVPRTALDLALATSHFVACYQLCGALWDERQFDSSWGAFAVVFYETSGSSDASRVGRFAVPVFSHCPRGVEGQNGWVTDGLSEAWIRGILPTVAIVAASVWLLLGAGSFLGVVVRATLRLCSAKSE